MSKQLRRSEPKLIGIYGGTFNPIHRAHVEVARKAQMQLGYDFIYFIPAKLPPHKKAPAIRDIHRLAMLRKVVKKLQNARICLFELINPGISYTFQTLDYLKKRHPSAEFHILIGDDNFFSFLSWKEPRKILKQAKLVIYPREKGRTKRDYQVMKNRLRRIEPSASIIQLKGRRYINSSSMIRTKATAGTEIDKLVHPSVCRYIEKYNLYR